RSECGAANRKSQNGKPRRPPGCAGGSRNHHFYYDCIVIILRFAGAESAWANPRSNRCLGGMTMGRNVLIVEDESIVAMELQEQVKGLDCGVIGPVSTAAAALRLCETNAPDLVLMDIRIQGAQDGVEAAQMLRRRFGVPVIYLTALADGITMERAKLTNPAGYLLKPVRPDELKAAVEIALYKSETDRVLEHQRAEFVAMLAHDIRSPLQTVSGC